MRIIIFALSAFTLAAPAIAAPSVAGRWVTQDGKGVVEIAPCGALLCGKIKKLAVASKGPLLDSNNSDPKLRTRPLLGLPILSGMKDAGAHWEGTIYSPERGRSYRSVIKRNPDGSLAVKGCQGPFCQTEKWTAAR